jgi:hypothetical protein
LQVGKHGLLIEFTDPNNNARRSATYLPEVAAHEGKVVVYCMPVNLIELFFVIQEKWTTQSEKENGEGDAFS